jgi:hypothetical protein
MPVAGRLSHNGRQPAFDMKGVIMKKTRIVLAVFLAGMPLCASGCLLVAVGAGAGGTVAYIKGELEATLDAGMDRSYDASLKALDQLHISPIQKTKDALTAEIVARTAEDKKITIKLTRVDEKITKLSIRVGFWGNQTQSTTIYERIKLNLK